MEKDFHYYLIYAICKITNCEHADIIAYSSQFVDDNNEGQFSIDGKKEFFPHKIRYKGGMNNYYPIMTQSLSPKSFDLYIQKYVYTPFHFMPGDNIVNIDGLKNPLSTTPDSENARAILNTALKSSDLFTPYRIGIALHTYADTWSHQNFTGIHESWNSVYPWYNVFKSIAPNIGHAEAGHSPDVISETWTDHRFDEIVKNRKRSFEAAGAIYKVLRKYTSTGPLWSHVKSDFKRIINASNYKKRVAEIDAFLNGHRKGPVPKYDENDWIDEALDRKGNEIVMRENFEKTHWHKFHHAAKSHFSFALDRIGQI